MRKQISRTLKLITFVVACLVISACITEGDVKGGQPAFDQKKLSDNSAERAVSYIKLNQLETAEDILKQALKKSPRHSTLSHDSLPSGEIVLCGPILRLSIAIKSSDPRSQHGVVPQSCTKCTPTGARLNIV